MAEPTLRKAREITLPESPCQIPFNLTPTMIFFLPCTVQEFSPSL